MSATERVGRHLRKHWAEHLAVAVIFLLLLAVLFPVASDDPIRAREARTSITEEEIENAILAYQTEYDAPPPGKDSASLIKELDSENPQGIAFLNLHPEAKNAQGEALDAWGTPLRVTIADPQHPIIQSAGPDRTWGTSDDLDNSKRSP